MDFVTIEEWKKIQLKTGKIISAEKIANRDRLYKLQVDIGLEKPIQIISGIVPFYTAEELIGKTIVVIANLTPATFAGETSQGMLLAADRDETSITLLTTDKEVKPGTLIR